MKRKRIGFFCSLFLLAVILCACAARTEMSYRPPTYEEQALHTLEDVPDIGVEWNITRQNIRFTLVNRAEDTLELASYYHLEAQTEDGWQTVLPIDGYVFTDELWEVPPGEAMREQSVEAKFYGVSAFAPGEYRLILEINRQGGAAQHLALPFTME